MNFDAIKSESSIIHAFPFNSEKKQGGVAVKRVLKEHSVSVVISKRSSLDKCKLPVGIRLFVLAAHTESDLQKAYESLKIVAASVLTYNAIIGVIRSSKEFVCKVH